jgi:hypothetical protein
MTNEEINAQLKTWAGELEVMLYGGKISRVRHEELLQEMFRWAERQAANNIEVKQDATETVDASRNDRGAGAAKDYSAVLGNVWNIAGS